MNIRIIIDKLGPITDSEIVFKPFMVLRVNRDWVRAIPLYCGIT